MSRQFNRREVMAGAAALSAAVALPAAAQSRPFFIFFDYGKSSLTPEANKIIDQVAAAIGQTERVTLIGHCDNTEPSPEKLGFARGNAVLTHFLRNPAMTKVRFNVTNEGASRPFAPSPPNTKEPLNRRVEIVIG
jgi:OOP family OmpA-OmpF porin